MTARLGHYDIVEELGRGGMGVVYKGYEAALGRYVAIKVLAAAMAHDPVFVERFLREARAMAALNDPHIIQIYFIGQDEEQTFFVMEFIDGDSLSGWLKREKKLPVGDALKILLQASEGLAAAHAQGVIHRDIKPGNIMINSRGVVKVADFGIALASNDISSSKLTSTGALVGTPGYLPPEACLGKAVDQRSDIFALGIVLFESLTGRMPFNDESPLKLMLDIVESNIPDIRGINPDVDEETVRILDRMLAKSPADRYQSCDELGADLRRHPQAAGALVMRNWSAEDASKATLVGLPTPQTGGHRPPRGATPPPQVGARTQPVMAQPQVAAAPATVQTQPIAAPAPPARSRTLPILVAVLLVLALAGWGLSRMLAGRTGAAVAEAPALAPASPPPPPATASAPLPATAGPAAAAAAGDAGAVPAAGSTAASLLPAPGAVPVDVSAAAAPTLSEDAINREVARRERLAAAATAAAAARAKRRAAAAAQASDDSGDTTVSDDEEGGGGRVDAAEARRKYLCRTQRRC
jgi:serine/threonine-protein kinase